MKLRTTPISIPAGPAWLDGVLAHSPRVRGLALVLLPGAVEQGQSREAHVVTVLQRAGLATLALNLLTRIEERDADARYNVPQLTNRVQAAAEWVAHQPTLAELSIGLVATGTACAAAIRVAAREPERYPALVCRGGRPDLAGAGPLRTLKSPVRFIVGALDPGRDIVARAYEHLLGPRDWQTVEGAGELFREPGTLDAAARLTAEWLMAKLPLLPEAEAPAAEETPARASPGLRA